MRHFAETDKSGAVLRVIVAEQGFIDKMPGTWVQTSYNAAGGKQKVAGGDVPLRMNYAGPGYVYDKALDAFIAPKPDAQATLDEKTACWVVPEKTAGMTAR